MTCLVRESSRPHRPIAIKFAAGLFLAYSTAAVLLLVFLLLVSCRSHPPEEKEKLPAVEVAKAELGEISQVVEGEAELYAYQQASLAPRISAPIRSYFVVPGQRVRKGQLLATMENRDLQAGVQQAQGELEQAQANYEITTGASVPQKLLAAEADLKNAQANLDAQQKLYDNRMALFHQGAIAGKELDQAAVALTAAKTQRDTALAQLEQTKATVAAQTGKSARGQLESARAAKQAAQVQLQFSELRSPIDGVVAYRNLYPGDTAPAGTALITVMDISRVIAKLHLPQNKAALLAVGNAATLHTAGGEVPGKVSVLSPALDPNSTTREVWVEAANRAAANSQPQLQPGSSVRVSIVAKTVTDALLVPASAIVTQDDATTAVVIVNPDRTVRRQPVELGIENGGKVQVLKGLAAGQEVVGSGAYGLPDGTKIEPTPVVPTQVEPTQVEPTQVEPTPS